MKKILHIIPSLRLGGEEKFLLDIYPFLSNKMVHVVCPFIHAGELYSDAVNLEKSKNNPIWVYIFKSRSVIAKLLKPTLFFYYLYRLRKLLNHEKPDAIITYAYGPMSAHLLCLLAIFSMHQKKFKWYVRFGSHASPYYFSNALIRKVFYKPIQHFLNQGLRSLIHRADGLIVVNPTLIKELTGVNGNAVHKTCLLPICISALLPSSSQSAEILFSNFLKKQPFLLATGRLEYIKGFDFLIKVFSLFSKNDDVKLIIFGEGSQKNALRKLVQSLKLEEKILFAGYMENPAWIASKAIACVVPSRSEGFGKIIIEAMQASLIVVASNCAGPQAVITDKVDGLLFEKENASALLQTLNDLMRMPAESKMRMKQNAYEKSLDYSPQKVAALLNAKLEMDFMS